jgi:hypothetical protein
VRRLSCLNDAQAQVDGDGVLRAVISKQDPGVHNWLDKADFPASQGGAPPCNNAVTSSSDVCEKSR